MENEKSTGNKYTVKDAAIIGIFCAVMFVVFMVYSTLTGASLFYSMIFNAAGAALILAPFYIYMCMKVGKHGPAPCLQYHVGDYRRTDDGAVYDSVVFGRRHHCRTFHVRKECLP